MVLFEIMLSQNLIQYTPKHTKLHHFKKFSRGGGGGACPRTMPCDMQISKSQKKNSWHPPLPNPGYALTSLHF